MNTMNMIKTTLARMITLAAAAVSLASCHFLEVEQVGKSDIDTYFSEVSALQPALNGCYHLLYSFYDREMLAYPEIAGDLVDLSSGNATWVNQYNFTSTYMEETTAVGYIWKLGYTVIQNVNYIVTYAPQLKRKYPDSSSEIDNILAQAYFIRALVHFDICLTYAQNYTYTTDASHVGVPIMTSIPVVTDKMRRSSVREVYSQVISDLEEALSTFNEAYSFSEYTASPAACKALLARVYLHQGEYSKAASLSAEVMGDFPLTPRDKYRNMYVNVATRGGESIFRLNGYDQSDFVSDLYYYESPSAVPSDKLRSLFTDERDVRLTLFSHSAVSGVTGKVVDYDNVCMKFYCVDETANKLDKHYDPFVLRSSEMYLINAEANYELGDAAAAVADIKALEARALGVDASEVAVDESALDQVIQNERMKELCFEGHRLFDITRRRENLSRSRNSTASTLFIKYPDYRFVLPIPYLEMESNPEMEQNPSNN